MNTFTWIAPNVLQELKQVYHRHDWILTLHDGRVVAVCKDRECDVELSSRQIEDVLNAAEL